MVENGLTGIGGKYVSTNKHPWEGISSSLFPNLDCTGASWLFPGEESMDRARGKEEAGLLEATTLMLAFLSSNLTSPLITETLGKNVKEQTGFMPPAFLLFHYAESHLLFPVNF